MPLILTDEQRARIAENREKALRIREVKAAERRAQRALAEASVPLSEPQTSANNVQLPEGVGELVPQSNPSLPDQNPNNNGNVNHVQQNPSGAAQQVQMRQPATFLKMSSPPKMSFKVDLCLVSPSRFKVTFKPFHECVISKLKQVSTRSYNSVDKVWTFSLTEHDFLIRRLKELNQAGTKVSIDEIPASVRTIFASKTRLVDTEIENIDLSPIVSIEAHLFQFQKRGVRFGISRNGRVLIADDMGLGKSIQALAISAYYQTEWPLLIVCPSSVKYAWQTQINKFLPEVKDNVFVVTKKSDPLPLSRNTSVVVIVSYDMMVLRCVELKRQQFYVTIFDECHMIKDAKARRTKTAYELSRVAHRVILLSGTPALSRPAELFTQIRMIDNRIFPYWHQYTERYCAAVKTRYGYDTTGQSNPEELAIVLGKIMIRRLKKDVLDDLPEKRREIIYLTGDSIEDKLTALKKARDTMLNYDRRKGPITKKEIRKTLMEYYVLTGQAKMHAVSDHITETYFDPEQSNFEKIIVFAHHQNVLDTICMALVKKGIKHIRIDGTTPAKERADLCDQFQNDKNTFAAVLSITAAGTGITLTAASRVIFVGSYPLKSKSLFLQAELYWNPSTMIQAEDRAHRVGQKDSVLVQYMVAKNTADTEIWQLLADKLKVLGEVNLSDENYGNANNREKICTSGLLITDFFKEIDETEEDETPAKREKMDDCNSIVEIHDEDEGNSRLEKRDDYSIIEVDDEEGN